MVRLGSILTFGILYCIVERHCLVVPWEHKSLKSFLQSRFVSNKKVFARVTFLIDFQVLRSGEKAEKVRRGERRFSCAAALFQACQSLLGSIKLNINTENREIIQRQNSEGNSECYCI